jgi:hypothetical protein
MKSLPGRWKEAASCGVGFTDEERSFIEGTHQSTVKRLAVASGIVMTVIVGLMYALEHIAAAEEAPARAPSKPKRAPRRIQAQARSRRRRAA